MRPTGTPGDADGTRPTTGPADEDPAVRLIADHGPLLLRLAAWAILDGLDGKPIRIPSAKHLPQALQDQGASFVTLTLGGRLRGCIGSPTAHRGLAADIALNAWAAASKDPRFPPVGPAELARMALSISLLTAPQPLPVTDEADLLEKMRPGLDGLILADRGRRGLFLPQVWEQLPEPATFLAHLKRKAGLPADHWSDTVTLQRFEARSIPSAILGGPEILWTRRAA